MAKNLLQDILASASLPNVDLSALETLQINSPIDFLWTSNDEMLSDALHVNPQQLKELRNRVLIALRPQPVLASTIVFEALSLEEQRVTTGILELDKILGGGIGLGEILELYGEPGSGKSQICMSVTGHLSQNSMGKVIYFDLNRDLDLKRLLAFCGGNRKALQNVLVFRPNSLDEFMKTLEDLQRDISSRHSCFLQNIRLLVVDSLPLLIYPKVEQDNQSWRYYGELVIQKICQGSMLNDRFAVLLVNHAVAANVKNLGSGNIKPALGNFWTHKVHFRLQLSRPVESKNEFTAVLEKSSRTPTQVHFQFEINDNSFLPIKSRMK